MTDTKTLKAGDPCPACGGPLLPAPTPTVAQRAAAANRDDPRPLPPSFDTAPEDIIAELGALHRCALCRYQARFPETAGDR